MREKPAVQRHQTGLSMIELLIVIAILGIVAALAAPSFSEAVVRNRIVSTNNDFLTGMSYARTEAIKRSNPVGICSLNAAFTGCGAGAWNRGWAVFEDSNDNGVFNAGEEVLRIFRLDSDDQLTSGTATIVFNSRGARTVPAANPTLTLRPTNCVSGTNNRRLFTVLATGSTSSQTLQCP